MLGERVNAGGSTEGSPLVAVREPLSTWQGVLRRAKEEAHLADLPPYPNPDTDTGAGPDRKSATSTSRWVYVLWIIGTALVLLFVVLHLAGAVGPGGH